MRMGCGVYDLEDMGVIRWKGLIDEKLEKRRRRAKKRKNES